MPHRNAPPEHPVRLTEKQSDNYRVKIKKRTSFEIRFLLSGLFA